MLVIVVFLAITAALLCGGTQPEPLVIDKASATIWQAEIHNRNSPGILDNWEIIEGLPLCKEAGAVDNRLAAFATVAFFGEPRVGIKEFALTERKFVVLAQNIKGMELSTEESKKMADLFKKVTREYGERKSASQYGTFMMGDALSLDETIKKCQNPREAVERIGKVHGWVASLEHGVNVPFEKCKEAIDKRIPILLEREHRYTVGIGYVRANGIDYLVVADLSKTPMEKAGMSYMPKEHEHFQGLPPDDPARKMYENDLKRKTFVVDFVVSSTKPLVAGITIEPFDQARYEAYFIYNWRISAEAWHDEIAQVVGAARLPE